MTAQRQENQGLRLRFAAAFAGLLILASGQALTATERVVTDRSSGLALRGFDPVAYFTDQAALSGDPEIEAASKGAIWRFRSDANRGYFLAHPEIYAPQFGGYDPVDVARGAPVAGQPRLFLVVGDRLYLFSREENLMMFAAQPSSAIEKAEQRWPSLKDTLAGY